MGTRILLADDSITIQKVVNLTFADEGIEVVAVGNGDLAERRLNEIKPDLVLADIFMPGKNGYELCESIKQNSQFRNIPVVLLVGAFEPFDQAEARRVQADAHLTKPFESRTLVETVRRLIGASGHLTTGPIAPIPAAELDAVPGAGSKPPTLTAPPAAKLDLSAMTADHKAAPVSSAARATGELASPALDAATEMFDLEAVDAQSREAVNATLAGAGDGVEPIEMPPIDELPRGDKTPPFDLDNQEMILDFDKPEPVEFPAPLSSVSFEADGSALLETDTNGVGEDAEWFSRDSLETRALEAPSRAEAWQAGATTSTLSRQAPDFRVQTEAAFAPSGGSGERAQATLLAVDDPLGDVLFDDPVSARLIPLSDDSLDIQFTEPAVTGAGASTQFDLIETAGNSSSQVFVAVEENTEGQEARRVEETMALNDRPDADVSGSRADSGPDSGNIADSLDWTSPRAGVYSTAQLDSVMMPIDTAEYLRAHSPNNDAQQAVNTEEAAFETAALWPEGEARFSAIDIEAFPVEEPGAAPDRAGAAETGFSLSSVAAEQPAVSDATPARATAGAASAGVPQATELSSAAIDEIVRRVVAEMSSSVVREVAWEVVPDCVERVIGQLTRESLSRQA
jgi:CheY-like chemotaxis protein